MKQQMHKEFFNKKGQMTIIIIISFCMILLSITLSQFAQGYSEYSQSSFDNRAGIAYEMAESAIENAIYEYQLDNTYSGGTFTTPLGDTTLTLSNNSSTNPPQETVTASTTYLKITRSITAIFALSNPSPIQSKAAFAQNNLYAYNSTLTGEIFTNNDMNLTNDTFNGDLFGAGKGNGQKNHLTNVEVKQYQGSGGNVSVWDPTYFDTGSSVVPGTVYYHTSLHIDNSSNIPNTSKQGNSFIPSIANPTFNFTNAKTLATQNGTYYASPTTFATYLASIGVTSNGNTTYTLPSGLYFIDCTSPTCILPYFFGPWDSGGNSVSLTGSNVSLIINDSFFGLGSINISSPYNHYPVIATNNDMYLLSATSSSVSVTLNGLVYANGTINAWGLASNNMTTINGGAWASNQLNLWNYVTLTYNSGYVEDVAGFGFTPVSLDSLSWAENP